MLYLLLTHYLLDPVAWVLYLLVAALIADHYRRPRLQHGLIAGAVLFLLGLMLLPAAELLARPLENEYPRPALPAHVDGIVILDGGLNSDIFATRGVMGENGSTMRINAGAELARRYPDAKLVYSGSSNSALAQERAAAESQFRAFGISPGRTLYEQTSRDTGESFTELLKLVHPRAGQTWVLVTSAVHMPRAMAIARKAGWTMLPWPSDYIAPANPRLVLRLGYPSEGLVGFDRALHEWVGLVYYRLRNRS
jgi:uncharacterized SAM-binding protein YcdF (DUF218 family)